MKPFYKIGIATLAAAAMLFTVGTRTKAEPQKHPAYLHALSDLRFARALLERPDGGELHQQEKDARHEIDKAIDEIKRAAIDDGKDLNDHPPVDVHLPWAGRLHKALEVLDDAHRDVTKEEDDPAAQGLQMRAIEHIDKAHHHVEEAVAIVH
jgi:hypothetical protein